MRRLFSFLFLPSITMGLSAQEYHFKKEFLEKWANAKTYTIKVAKLMPEENYDFRPAPKSRTFREQVEHMAESISYLAGMAIDLADKDGKSSRRKQDLLDRLELQFDQVHHALVQMDEAAFETRVKFWDGPTSRRKLLNFTLDHITHHRAQAVVYLRINGIKPPGYIGW